MEPRVVIVGVDASPESERAAALGVQLAGATGGECRLVNALADNRRMGVTVEHTQEMARRQLEIALRDVVPPEVLSQLHVGVGHARAVLADEARRANAWVVVGGKPHAPLAPGMGWTTPHHLARTLHTPLIVTGASANPIRRVLVAVDLTDAAPGTLRAGIDVARSLDASVLALHATETDVARAEDALGQLVADAGDADEVRIVARHGTVSETIAAEVTAWSADLVVIGSHGGNRPDRVGIGMTADRLLSRLPAAVLVVPASWHPVPPRRHEQREGRYA